MENAFISFPLWSLIYKKKRKNGKEKKKRKCMQKSKKFFYVLAYSRLRVGTTVLHLKSRCWCNCKSGRMGWGKWYKTLDKILLNY